MLITVNNLRCHVKKASTEELEWLDDYLSFPDVKKKYARWKRFRGWENDDGKIHMLSEITRDFPTGFLDIVRTTAKKDKIKLKIVDKRRATDQPDLRALIDWLRDYQTEATDIAKLIPRGVFQHVTGAGKTEVMVALCELFPNTTWLICVHRKDLLLQTADRFRRRTGEEVGIIGDGKCEIRRVNVAMFHTLHARWKKRHKQVVELMHTCGGVMVDECHIVPANTFWRVIMNTRNAYFRYGFSGTPFARGDKKSVYTWGALGPIIHQIKADRLNKAGVIAMPKIRMVPVKQHARGANWAEVYKHAVTESVKRNFAIVSATKQAQKPCLLFVKEIGHGKLLEDALQTSGEKVEFVWGKKKLPIRQAAIRRLVHGDTDVLICNVIFQEGIDIPELQSIVIASGGKSTIMALQDVGRGMRRHDRQGRVTKEEFEVFDIFDEGCGCAGKSKHLGCKWLEKHRRKRIAAFVSAGYSVVRAPKIVSPK